MEQVDVERLALEVFGDKDRACAWLTSHNLALGVTPASLLATKTGRDEVAKVLTDIAGGGTA